MASVFLPTTMTEARKLGWAELDIVLISADAYVDHPSFGAAMIGRVLQNAGYRVGIIPQPNPHEPADFTVLGRPRLFFGISTGSVDSMLIHYTALKRVRNDDPYTPGGGPTRRPKRAAIAYTAALKHACKDVPIVLGGMEASTRRLAHYDYWDDKVRRSVLVDSKADLLVYGMGEKPIVEIANRLSGGESFAQLTDVAGTVYRAKEPPDDALRLPEFSRCSADEKTFVRHYRMLEDSSSSILAENDGAWWVVQNPRPPEPTTAELDGYYELPFLRRAHPRHEKEGGVPALKTVAASIVSHRGCLADCSFCSISLHQGRNIVNRSKESVLREAKRIAAMDGFDGTITDVGGPSANMYGMECKTGGCESRDCVGREICPNLSCDHGKYLDLLESVARVQGVKHVFVGSGIRYDLLMTQPDAVLEKVIKRFVGGQMKVAPEHASQKVLELMNKPSWSKYERFRDRFYRITSRLGLKRHVIPYLITSHPGATLEDEKELLEKLEEDGFVPDQVQDFIPLPMTRAGVMYHTRIDPHSNKRVFVAHDRSEKERHFALLRPKQAKYRKLRQKLLGDNKEQRRPPRKRGRRRKP